MTREEWIRLSHKMREPMQELARIAAQAQVMINVCTWGQSEPPITRAIYVDEEKGLYNLAVDRDGKMKVEIDEDEGTYIVG